MPTTVKYPYNKEAIKDRLRTIATMLGLQLVDSVYDLESEVVRSYLQKKDDPDYKIYCYAQSHKYEGNGKVQFSVEFPNKVSSRDSEWENSCNSLITKDLGIVVADIQKKVLYNYEENLEIAKDREAQWVASENARQALEDRLVEEGYVERYPKKYNKYNIPDYFTLQLPAIKFATVKVLREDAISLNILSPLTPEQTFKILELLRTL
jgi:hypothetical protein